MPLYVYECPCGQVFDVTHSIHEDPDVECDNCGGYMFRKPQPTVVTFNSGGFYSTDKNKK
jgi:putative FmdB family regulatory protein